MKISNSREIPTSLYRLQLNSDFPLKKALKILPYLKSLGIEGVYCSPYYDAYSPHGYDITNPNTLNPEIGTLEEFDAFCEELKRCNLKQIIDVVPNHMGFRGGKNLWWQDVLENGPYSAYASFFDINWSPEKKELQDKVMFPILGKNYGEALESQEIKFHFKKDTFWLQYMDFPLPLAPHTYAMILETDIETLKHKLKKQNALLIEYQNLVELFRFFPVVASERKEKKREAQEKLSYLIKNSAIIKKHIEHVVETYKGKKRIPESFDALDKLLDAQFYRLAFWKVATHEINYRRFFNIQELVALRIEEEEVFNAHHRWIFELMEQGRVQGLRIDHPDGLYDPVQYFDRLRKKFPIYTVVEKILDRKETLPETWQVEGTVGYEFLNLLNGIFIRQDSEKIFSQIYQDFLKEEIDFDACLYRCKKFFAFHEMASEVEALGLTLDRLSEHTRYYRDFTRHDLVRALAEVIACFPVYRTYIGPQGKLSKNDAHYITIAIEKAKSRGAYLDPSVFQFLKDLLLLKLKIRNPQEKEGYREFVLKFQQVTAPMMAKGLEDTAFYIYNRFISLNEVGGDPPHFGNSIPEFHRFNIEKREKWPFGYLPTSTHDSKRSEDVRMRLNVLSEIPSKWRLELKKWRAVNAKYKNSLVSANTEYFIYQTLLGVWPREPVKKNELEKLKERIWSVLLKSLREAKQETSWLNPNLEYEEAVRNFFFSILSVENILFLQLFLSFEKELDRLGELNSLSATVLKMGSCGVVDIYQGNELLNYRMVDPDNREPVDFEQRKKTLNAVKNAQASKLFIEDDSGNLKFYVHWKALHFREENKRLFLEGDYIPLKVRGVKKNHVIAFMRVYKNQRLIVACARFFVSLVHKPEELPLGKKIWKDTEIILPKAVTTSSWTDLFSQKKISGKKRATLAASDLFESLSFCFLYNE